MRQGCRYSWVGTDVNGEVAAILKTLACFQECSCSIEHVRVLQLMSMGGQNSNITYHHILIGPIGYLNVLYMFRISVAR